jgi:hypothetical protein
VSIFLTGIAQDNHSAGTFFEVDKRHTYLICRVKWLPLSFVYDRRFESRRNDKAANGNSFGALLSFNGQIPIGILNGASKFQS